LLTVTFDDKITALDTIISKLEKGGNKINGKPVYVK
jgi:exonuclease VII small subunit